LLRNKERGAREERQREKTGTKHQVIAHSHTRKKKAFNKKTASRDTKGKEFLLQKTGEDVKGKKGGGENPGKSFGQCLRRFREDATREKNITQNGVAGGRGAGGWLQLPRKKRTVRRECPQGVRAKEGQIVDQEGTNYKRGKTKRPLKSKATCYTRVRTWRTPQEGGKMDTKREKSISKGRKKNVGGKEKIGASKGKKKYTLQRADRGEMSEPKEEGSRSQGGKNWFLVKK